MSWRRWKAWSVRLWLWTKTRPVTASPTPLDVPMMMMSFLAHSEGGVSVSESAATTATGARERVLKGREAPQV